MKEAILKTLRNMVTEDREGNPILYAMDDDLKLLTNKLNEAINYTHCCKSYSEQLCDEENLGKVKKLYTKVGDEWVEYKTE